MKDVVAASAGCMCSVFQLLHFQSPTNHDHHHTMSKGKEVVEEALEPQMNASSSPIRIKTKLSKSTRDDECGLDSPAGTKTPCLIARLMGLDYSVEIKARSLPETPRISLVLDYHSPRLSLQINKENMNREFDFSEKLRERLRHQQRSSAGHFVERVKDRVSRRRGGALSDITNDRDRTRVKRGDGNLIPVEVKITKSENDSHLQEQRVSKAGSGEKGKKYSSKSKRTPLLSDPNLLQAKKNMSPHTTKLLPNQLQVSLSDAISSKRNTRLSIERAPEKILALPDIPTGCAAGETSECRIYIQKILNRAGITSESDPFTSAKHIDPSIFHYLERFHPIFAASGGNAVLSRRCNRKLIFQLVKELMIEISRSHFNFNRWVPPITGRDGGSPLVDELCKRIGSFPAGSCLVREDIDSLVERELRKLESKELFREEESVVREIEGEIVESLLCETAAMAVRR